MALTNFGNLNTNQKTVWSRDLWKQARNSAFMTAFLGRGSNAMIQRVTELTKSEKGTRAVISLVADLLNVGVAGDSTLEGNEEAIQAYDQIIQIDQLRHANRREGRVAEQKVIVDFREQSRDVLGYWLGDRWDQMAFLTLSGIDYSFKNNGDTRPVLAAGQNLTDLDFAGDVTLGTTTRRMRWDATAGDYVTSEQINTTFTGGVQTTQVPQITSSDKISYKALVKAKALAKNTYMRGIRGRGNEEVFHVFVSPNGMANLKLDSDYLANVRNAMPRSRNNELFAGTSSVMVDGMVIHEFRHVFNTTGATAPAKWGSDGSVEGERVLFCGAQALGFADIGAPIWDERDHFDYGNQIGIAVGKICGFKKPVFQNIYTGQAEDFGVMTLDFAL